MNNNQDPLHLNEDEAPRVAEGEEQTNGETENVDTPGDSAPDVDTRPDQEQGEPAGQGESVDNVDVDVVDDHEAQTRLTPSDDQYLDMLDYADAPSEGRVINQVQVKFCKSGRSGQFDGEGLPLERGCPVVVDGPHGTTIGKVAQHPCRCTVASGTEIPRVGRCAGAGDIKRHSAQQDKERDAFTLCQRLIKEMGLPMKLVSVEFNHHLNRGLFLFSSESRVDFRQLVRELATQLRCRVDMRQIGVRDEAAALGAIGHCGLHVCCHSFLKGFSPVSIRMAKDQNLALNPDKVSGVCGRLMCCLVYEQPIYKELSKGLPKTGKTVETPLGKARVREVDVLRQRIRIQAEDGTIAIYAIDELRRFWDGEDPAPAPSLQTSEPSRRPRGGETQTRTPSAGRPPRGRAPSTRPLERTTTADSADLGPVGQEAGGEHPSPAQGSPGDTLGGGTGDSRRRRSRRRKRSRGGNQARPDGGRAGEGTTDGKPQGQRPAAQSGAPKPSDGKSSSDRSSSPQSPPSGTHKQPEKEGADDRNARRNQDGAGPSQHNRRRRRRPPRGGSGPRKE